MRPSAVGGGRRGAKGRDAASKRAQELGTWTGSGEQEGLVMVCEAGRVLSARACHRLPPWTPPAGAAAVGFPVPLLGQAPAAICVT